MKTLTLTTAERKLLKEFRKLDADDQQLVADLLDSIRKAPPVKPAGRNGGAR